MPAVTAAADLPSANAATSTYSGKTSLIAYDNLGNEVTIDVYSRQDRAQHLGGHRLRPCRCGRRRRLSLFQRPAGSGHAAVSMRSGQLASGSPTSLSFTIPNGGALHARHVANEPARHRLHRSERIRERQRCRARCERVEISDDGYLYAVFENGTRVPTYRIPLADVPSPDNLHAAGRQRVRASASIPATCRSDFAPLGRASGRLSRAPWSSRRSISPPSSLP